MRYGSRAIAIGLLTSMAISSASASATKYRWRKGQVTVSISSSITSNIANIAANADTNGAIDRSLASWQRAAAISIRRVSTNEQNVSPAGLQGDGISVVTIAATAENVALFPQGIEDATARTRVFYDARGFITEADIVLNPYLQFSTDGTPGTFDLESTMTHEIGHMLGLGHSPVLSATMGDDYGRNGIYNLPAFSARTLASDDIAAIRSLYGPAERNEECCGRIAGRLTTNGAKPAANFTIWAEDSDDGRVIAATISLSDGSFKLGGLPVGKVRLYAQGGDGEPSITAADIGEFSVSQKQPINVVKRVDRSDADLRLDYVGFNGQLAGMAVPVNAGSIYSLFVGSTEMSGKELAIESSSDQFVINSRSTSDYFGNGIRTLGFDLSVSSTAPAGEYSISLRSEMGHKRCLIGAITVEKFPNFWSLGNAK